MSKSEMPLAEWRRLIEQRRRNSVLWQLIHLLGSLKLAVVLLLALAVATGIATFYEAKFDARVAQAYFYNAPWFVFWLAMLILNLACATLTRWPWRRKHYGFVITHGGIILLLIGAFIGYHFGFEGSITLQVGEEPKNRLVTPQSVLQVIRPNEGAFSPVSFDPDLKKPTPERPMRMPLPGTGTRLVVDEYSDYLIRRTRLVEDPAMPEAAPGVALVFESATMGEVVPVHLLGGPGGFNRDDFFGLAEVVWYPELPERGVRQPEDLAFQQLETHVVMARHPEEAIIHAPYGRTGYRFLIAGSLADGLLLVIESPSGLGARYQLDDVVGEKIRVDGGAAEVEVAEFWPDFDMKDGVPVSLSEELRNPAVLVHLHGPADLPGAQERLPVMELAPAGEGRVAYQLSRGGAVYSRGEAGEGDEIHPGWADWVARVETVAGQGVLSEEILRVDPGEVDGETAIPGVQVRLEALDGRSSEPAWLLSGRRVTLALRGEIFQFNYGLRSRALPFTVSLENFEVPRDEGTDQPANFISTVRFHDPETGDELLTTLEMNHPASYPSEWWRGWTGFRYKFSQASWDPDNLDQSTLQVLYDPGWFFKWVGSVLICIGITIMFYFKPREKSPGPNGARETAASAGRRPEPQTTT